MTRQPGSHAFWRTMFSSPLTFVEAEFSFEVHQLQRSHPLSALAAGTGHQTSRNWSGAYITPRDGRMFTEVHGEWRVPKVSVPDGGSTDIEYRSSTWIGLDGQRRYLNSSLPQIGTAQFVEVVDGEPVRTTTCWWQWWLRDHLYPPITLSLEVHPHDRVMCSLTVIGETLVKFMIKNATTGECCTPFIRKAPMADLPHPPSPVQVKVSGATAEWVLERPTELAPDGELYELPDYGTVDFRHCHAVSALAPQGSGRDESLVGARSIDMYKEVGYPRRTVVISEVKRLEADRVKTAYR